jgi:hypothetical protein
LNRAAATPRAMAKMIDHGSRLQKLGNDENHASAAKLQSFSNH